MPRRQAPVPAKRASAPDGTTAPRATVGFSGWAWWRLRPANDNKPPLSVVLAGSAFVALAVVALGYTLARWAF